ncbi:MAG: alpha-mannosidase, partial [Planctomycetes bacterium]|nr:alpha-mannosidase [Planctomycetota bacterium]
MATVHLILNAHLDPIWLWPWQAGLDAALATCRSACERLDAHPDVRFTQGEAWLYREVERADPALFARMRGHIAAGRWEVAGGWWTQPDCNLPSGFALRQQIALGMEWFRDRFGSAPRIACNPDSFGHAATLPALMRAAGQEAYVMMRPQESELALPARLFRWRGQPDGAEVTVFRIADAYCTRTVTRDFVQRATTDLPAGCEHTMCFIGVGDHGGGPTEAQIAWCRANRDAIPGWRLEFSTLARFFAAVAPMTAALPLVVGELQQHAIGCYSVQRSVKTAIRRAEHLLARADAFVGPAGQRRGWERVCLHHFHDTLGGTCIPSAYRQVKDAIGGAAADADQALHHELRRRLRALPDDARQRLVVANASNQPFNGWIEHEPWLESPEGIPARQDFTVVDDADRPVPSQRLEPEALCHGLVRIAFRAALAPNEVRAYHLDYKVPAGAPVNDIPSRWREGAGLPTLTFADGELAPRLVALADDSDTWSHGRDRYADAPNDAQDQPVWSPLTAICAGPLVARAPE